jgi:hypothetical protein
LENPSDDNIKDLVPLDIKVGNIVKTEGIRFNSSDVNKLNFEISEDPKLYSNIVKI